MNGYDHDANLRLAVTRAGLMADLNRTVAYANSIYPGNRHLSGECIKRVQFQFDLALDQVLPMNEHDNLITTAPGA